MGSYLAGADIHDFLACLGKHALEKISFGFSILDSVEPECPKVFVEDPDEYVQCTDAFSLPNEGKKEVACDGWGECIPKEDNRGWDEEPTGEVNNHASVLDTGWETAESHPVAGDGWGDKQATVQDAGWDQNDNNDVDKANHISCEGGWGGSKEETASDDWGFLGKSAINMTDPAAQTGNQDSLEGQNGVLGKNDINMTDPAAQTGNRNSIEGLNRANAASKGGFMHPSRRSRITADSTDDPGANERQSGNFAPSGTNTVPLGRRKKFGTADTDVGLTDDKQCEYTGWGAGAPSTAGADDFGWGAINCEATTDVNANQQGSGQDNWAEMVWEKPSSDLANQSSKNDSMTNDAWQTLPETSGGDGWGHDNTWHCKKSNVETYETASPGWDAMEAKQGSKRSTDFTPRTERQNADERRSGKFAPSGSNSVPLGKRRAAVNTTVSNDEPESMMTSNAQSSGGKDDPMGWVNQAEKTEAVQDSGWDTANLEDNGKLKESSLTTVGIDGWGSSDAEWGTVSADKSQGMDKQRTAKCDWSFKSYSEASADLNGWGSDVQTAKKSENDGWGSDVQTAKNGDNDGWGDIKSDSASVPCSGNLSKGSSSTWDLGAFHTQPSKGYVEQDGTPRPRKKVNRGSFGGDSWAGFAAKCPQTQSRRPRLRSLLNSPEYSELDELYKAANKILHHNEYQLGDKLKTEDEKFILEKILVHHQDKEAKVGCGVDYVTIDSHAEHQVSCFWVVRTDGTRTDFSYWKCLERLYETKYSQVATTDGAKDETAKGSSNVGWGSGSSVKGIGDNGKTKGSADLSESIPDQKEAQQNWDKVASSIKGVNQREAKDCWDIRASSTTSTQNRNDQGDGWDTWAADPESLTESKFDQGHAEGTWDKGDDSAVNISEQATRTDVPQEAATNDGWGSF